MQLTIMKDGKPTTVNSEDEVAELEAAQDKTIFALASEAANHLGYLRRPDIHATREGILQALDTLLKYTNLAFLHSLHLSMEVFDQLGVDTEEGATTP